MKRHRPLAVPILLLLSAGCYTYQPVASLPTATDIAIAARLSDAGSGAMASLLGANAASVEGSLQAADDSTFTLAVGSVTRQGGVAERWNGERVRLLRRDVASVSTRHFSASRTALVGLGGIAAAILAAKAFGMGGDVGTQVITPPPPAR